MGTDFSFPVPWKNIPENIWLTVRLIYSAVRMSDMRAKIKFLRDNGALSSPGLHSPNVLWISQDMAPHAGIPLDYTPKGVISAGPIVLHSRPAIEQDCDLVQWLQRSPTVLINLGSHFRYSRERISTMAQAIGSFLKQVDMQVLWKLGPESPEEVNPETLSPIQRHIDNDTLRHVDWISVDTLSLLETGYVAGLVHHGGANSYYEAI